MTTGSEMADLQRLPRWLPILNQVGSVDIVEMRLMWRCNVVVVILNLHVLSAVEWDSESLSDAM